MPRSSIDHRDVRLSPPRLQGDAREIDLEHDWYNT